VVGLVEGHEADGDGKLPWGRQVVEHCTSGRKQRKQTCGCVCLQPG
jgi:hypothetical protein